MLLAAHASIAAVSITTLGSQLCRSNRQNHRSCIMKIEAFLTRLAITGVSASTQNQAFNALVFVYEKFIGIQLGPLGEIARYTRPHLPCLFIIRSQIVSVFQPHPYFHLHFSR